MSETPDSDLLKRAADPQTPATELQQLARQAALRPVIATNPTAYTALLDWIAKKHEPAVLQALAQRQQAFDAGQSMDMPSRRFDLSDPEEPAPLEDGTTADTTGAVAVSAESSAAESSAESASATTTSTSSAPIVRSSILGATATGQTVEIPVEDSRITPRSAQSESPTSPSANASRVSAGNPGISGIDETPPAVPDPTVVLPPINTVTAYPGGYAQAGQAAAPYATAPYGAGAYGAAMPGAPAMPGVPQAPGVQKGSSNKVLWVIFGILLALVIVLAAVLTTMFLSKNNAESTDSTTSSASAQPGKDSEGADEPGDSDKASSTDKGKDKDSADSKDEDSAKAKDKAKDTAKPSPTETVAPAPSDAQHSNRLTTKTGNMTCSIQRADMWCTVKDQNGGIAGCPEDQSITVALGDSGGPVSSCTSKSDYATQGNVLEYDQTITSGDFACTSGSEGTTCWNTVTGKGFFLARQDYHEVQKP